MGCEEFSELRGGLTVQIVMGLMEGFEFNAEVNSASAMLEGWGGMFRFMYPYQDPGSAVLNILEHLEALDKDPNKECITVVQHGGEKAWPSFIAVGRERDGDGEREKSCRYG